MNQASKWSWEQVSASPLRAPCLNVVSLRSEWIDMMDTGGGEINTMKTEKTA